MSLLPPQIDSRSYDEIVAQVAMLAEYFTHDLQSEIEPTIANLLNRTLDEDITGIASLGTVLELAIARQISQRAQQENRDRIKVRGGWYPPGTSQVRPTISALVGHILNQDVLNETELIATRGTPIDTALAERISRIPGLTWVKVRSSPGEIDIEPTIESLVGRVLNQDIANPANRNQPIALRGTRIDLPLAEQIAQQNLSRVNVKVVPDAGWALIRLFSRLAVLVRDRLNQVPEKNLLAFLDLIGVQVLPPQAARVPLTFYLAEGTSTDILVPAHTPVAASAEPEEVVFETEHDLLATIAQLKAVFVHEPQTNRYSDRTAIALGEIDAAFPAFVGEQAIERSLYVACDELLTLPGTKNATLVVDSPTAELLKNLPITWFYWDGTTWQEATQATPVPPQVVRGKWQVTLKNLPALKPHSLEGTIARGNSEAPAGWLQGRINTPLSSQSPRLHIEKIQVQVTMTRRSIQPDHCFFNTVPIDLSKDFYPFGEQPRFNDTFYIASKDVFAKAATEISVEATLSKGREPNKDGKIKLIWEAWSGQKWEEFAKNSDAGTANSDAGTAKNLTATGTFSATLPSTVQQQTIGGETNYWIRVRIIEGHYGEPASTTSTENDTSGRPIYRLTPATFNPPSLESFSLSYTYTSETVAASAVRIYDRLTLTDPFALDRTTKLIQERKSGEKTLKLESVEGWIVGDRIRITDSHPEANQITQIDPTTEIVTLASPLTQSHALHTSVIRDFQPFQPIEDTRPTLYLGFDRPLPNRAIALYFQVDPPTPGEITSNPRPVTPAQLGWEYTTPTGWSRLNVQDETELFSDRGLIRLIAPDNFAARREFGQSLYWLRCRWETGSFRVPPRLRRLLINTMWASQTTTLTDEILGSSTGNPNQSFRAIRTPVLAGQTLEVIEDSETMQWQEVPDFYGSSASDRHYTLDRLTGTIRFGDGQRGRVPPTGSNNLRLHYRTGGGTQGKQAAETITQLKTTIPSIDRVTNLEPAGGGAEAEEIERVKARGAKFLRHRDRAVTAEDLEDLAFVASPAVARAKAITPHFDPITLQWFPSYPIRLDQAGEIQVTVAVEASLVANLDLDVKLYGPAQSNAYAQHIIRSNRDRLTFNVTPELFEFGNAWRITVTNRNDNNLQGTLTIATPNGSQNYGLEAPASGANREILDAGKVELIIVPQSTAAQPTPSLMLINQVEQYLRDRASPTLDLQVTEPDWVEVAVRAAVVPVSLGAADAARTAASAALTRFLHPLTGGSRGQGWSFGRRPFPSDLYAVLESIPEIDHVTSLSIVSIPSLGDDPTITPLPADRFDRFLIYSGQHQIILP